MRCSCCGEDRDPGQLVAVPIGEGLQVCRSCIGWLRHRAGIPDSTPIFPVREIDEACKFYEAAGFEVRPYDAGDFAFVSLDGESVFDLDLAEGFEADGNLAGCHLIVSEVDDWYGRLLAAGLPVSEVADQPWGMREFTLTDPNGNYVRIGRSTSG